VRKHRGPKWDNASIVKKAFKTSNGQGLQSMYLN